MPLLYEQVADRLAGRIRAGEFLPGDKLPSLRALCQQEGISLMTAVAALSQLESIDLVKSKPRSGFIVTSPKIPRIVGLPPLDTWGERSKESKREAAIAEVVNGLGDPRLITLGAGCPAPELFPNHQLSQLLRREIRKDALHSARYSPAPGDLGLRRELCRRLNSRGCRLDPSRLLLTAGCMEALAITLGNLLRPDDRVIVEVPSFFGIHQLLRRLHVEIREVPTDEHGIDLESVSRIVKSERIRAAVLMPNFTNPTGALLSNEKKKALLRLLNQSDVAIVEDDIYADLGYRGARPRPLLSFHEGARAPHYMVGSFSKSISPGLRVGFIASSAEIFALSINKFSTNIGNNRLAELVAAEVFKSGLYEKHTKKLASTFETNVKRFQAAVVKHFPRGTRVSDPRGGFVLWVEVPGSVDARTVYEKSLAAGISVAPGFIFSTRYRLDRFIRLNAGAVWSDRVAKAIRTTGEIACGLAGSAA
jgi:DNA-binding transcriptional MocR family regulator